jgi:hypothetical protein
MTYSFVVPPELQAMWEAGKLIRRGALLINANGGGIVAHLQETGAFSAIQPLGSVLSSLTGVTSAGSLVTGAISVVQNEQIKRRIDVMQSMLGAMQGLQVATLAGVDSEPRRQRRWNGDRLSAAREAAPRRSVHTR